MRITDSVFVHVYSKATETSIIFRQRKWNSITYVSYGQAYFNRKDVDLTRVTYLECNFSREVLQSETLKLKKEMDQLRVEKLTLEDRLETQRQEMLQIL